VFQVRHLEIFAQPSDHATEEADGTPIMGMTPRTDKLKHRDGARILSLAEFFRLPHVSYHGTGQKIHKVLRCITALLVAIVVLTSELFGGVDPETVYARAFALLAAEPYAKKGFQVREDYWTGNLASGERKVVRQQLFKGNEYWFWLGTEVDGAKVSVHIYNSDGVLAEQPDSWAKEHSAAAHIVPKRTGSYYIIVTVETSPAARTHWALAYGFR
jgi:hypothetical protein